MIIDKKAFMKLALEGGNDELKTFLIDIANENGIHVVCNEGNDLLTTRHVLRAYSAAHGWLPKDLTTLARGPDALLEYLGTARRCLNEIRWPEHLLNRVANTHTLPSWENMQSYYQCDGTFISEDPAEEDPTTAQSFDKLLLMNTVATGAREYAVYRNDEKREGYVELRRVVHWGTRGKKDIVKEIPLPDGKETLTLLTLGSGTHFLRAGAMGALLGGVASTGILPRSYAEGGFYCGVPKPNVITRILYSYWERVYKALVKAPPLPDIDAATRLFITGTGVQSPTHTAAPPDYEQVDEHRKRILDMRIGELESQVQANDTDAQHYIRARDIAQETLDSAREATVQGLQAGLQAALDEGVAEEIRIMDGLALILLPEFSVFEPKDTTWEGKKYPIGTYSQKRAVLSVPFGDPLSTRVLTPNGNVHPHPHVTAGDGYGRPCWGEGPTLASKNRAMAVEAWNSNIPDFCRMMLGFLTTRWNKAEEGRGNYYRPLSSIGKLIKKTGKHTQTSAVQAAQGRGA
jgi:hypothetical protein